MRRFIYDFLKVTLLVVCLAFIFSPHASAEWTKYSTNPILSPGGGSWDTIHIRNPSVIHDGNEYKMWYDGYDGTHWKIGYATSSDGIHWTKRNTPVVDQSTNNLDSAEPNVLYDSGKYKMWFTSLTGDNTFSSIDYVESDDGIHWTTPLIVISKTEPWESQFIAHPHVIKVGAQYNLYYDGESNNVWTLAIATSPNGVNWLKSSSNPLLLANGDESPTIGLGSVLYDGLNYQIFYHGKHPPKVFYSATSTNGYDWVRNTLPLISTTPNSFDKIELISPFVLKDGNMYKMWYSGYDGSNWSIGYATEPVSDTLSVPLLKQTDPQWGNQIYDSANQWITGNEQPTISWWGCAVTSLAMVLQHYGYNLLPDGTPLNPGTLNSWLISQPDGYINGGLVNWFAIPRLTMQAKSLNHITNIDALEFQWITGADKNQLTQDLNNFQPDILEEPGHFIVGTQIDNTTFDINDPYYNRTTLDNGYNNTFLSLRRYTPSQTDLSYILLTIDPSITVSIKDPQGHEIGQQTIENPITNPYSTSSGTLKPVKEIFIPKPQNGQYTVTVSSDTSSAYNLSLYLYDKNGNVNTSNKNGFIGTSSTDTFIITMNTDSLENSSADKDVTFQSLLNELKQFYHDGHMKIAAYKSITSLVKSSNNSFNNKRVLPAKIKIDTSLFLIQTVFKNKIDSSAADILSQDLKTLKGSF